MYGSWRTLRIDFFTLTKFQQLQFTRLAGLSHRHTCIDLPSSRACGLWSWLYVALEVRWTFLEPGCQQSPLHSCQRLPDRWRKHEHVLWIFSAQQISLTTGVRTIAERLIWLKSRKTCPKRPPPSASKSGLCRQFIWLSLLAGSIHWSNAKLTMGEVTGNKKNKSQRS